MLDRWLQMEVQPKLEILKFHQGNVRGVAFSPVVSTQHDATFLIASVKEFKCLHCLTCDVFCFLQDRYLFCSGAYDGKINVYDAKKCNLLGSYPVSLCFILIIDQTHRQNERHCSSSAVTKNHRGVEKIILNVCLWGGGWAYHWLPFRRFHSKFQDGILKWRVWLWMMY